MKPLVELQDHDLRYFFTDIDDTLTDEGRLQSVAYEALWKLQASGLKVVPITGRPAGWCELIARQWPVDGVIGENGAFYFRYHKGTMKRWWARTESERADDSKKLEQIEKQILEEVPGAALASDQFCRLFDLAIDFCEDVPPLSGEAIQRIKKIFEDHHAQAKVSSIHVNGWFGEHNKRSTCLEFLDREFRLTGLNEIQKQACFVGDSPNDEPLFEFFPYSFGVANVQNFAAQMQKLPTYVATLPGGRGFAEIATRILACRKV